MQRRFSFAQLHAEKIAADPAPRGILGVYKNRFSKTLKFGLHGSNREGATLDHSKLFRAATIKSKAQKCPFLSLNPPNSHTTCSFWPFY